MKCVQKHHFYRNDWPSDITLWVNDIEVGTWTSPGDFGGRRKGKIIHNGGLIILINMGLLKYWRIKKDGTYIDNMKLSDKKISEILN